jgi:hypothetical protein
LKKNSTVGSGCGQTTLEQRLVVWPAPGGDQTANASLGRPKQLLQQKILQEISMIQAFTNQGEEQWRLLKILTRIRNLSKVAIID